MFIDRTYGHYGSRNRQLASGTFIVLLTRDFLGGSREIRTLARNVTLSQSGHFMTGFMEFTFRGERCRFWLSGTYGADGLTKDIYDLKIRRGTEYGEKSKWDDAPPAFADELWRVLTPLPEEVSKKLWTAKGGWNCAGEEGPSIEAWAKEHIREIRKLPLKRIG